MNKTLCNSVLELINFEKSCANCQCWPNKAVEWVILFRLTSRYCSKNMIYCLSCQTAHPEQKDSILPVSAFRGGANIPQLINVRASVGNYNCRNCWLSTVKHELKLPINCQPKFSKVISNMQCFSNLNHCIFQWINPLIFQSLSNIDCKFWLRQELTFQLSTFQAEVVRRTEK